MDADDRIVSYGGNVSDVPVSGDWTGTGITMVVQAARAAIFSRYKYEDDLLGKFFCRSGGE